MFRWIDKLKQLLSPASRRAPAPQSAADRDPDPGAALLTACKCGTPVQDFLRGPRGGSAQNCQCPFCGNWWNLGWLPGLDHPLLLEDQGQRTDIDLRDPATTPARLH